MPESVTEVYKWVVDDVIQKVQELFVQEGIEQYVQELLCFLALLNLPGKNRHWLYSWGALCCKEAV